MSRKDRYDQDLDTAMHITGLLAKGLLKIGQGIQWFIRDVREQKVRQQEALEQARQLQTIPKTDVKETARSRVLAALDADLSPRVQAQIEYQSSENNG